MLLFIQAIKTGMLTTRPGAVPAGLLVEATLELAGNTDKLDKLE